MDIKDLLHKITKISDYYDRMDSYDPEARLTEYATGIVAAVNEGIEGDLSEVNWKALLGPNFLAVDHMVKMISSIDSQYEVLKAIHGSWIPNEMAREVILMKKNYQVADFIIALEKYLDKVSENRTLSERNTNPAQKGKTDQEQVTIGKTLCQNAPAKPDVQPHSKCKILPPGFSNFSSAKGGRYLLMSKGLSDYIKGDGLNAFNELVYEIVHTYQYIENAPKQIKSFLRTLTGLDVGGGDDSCKLKKVDAHRKYESMKSLSFLVSTNLIKGTIKEIVSVFDCSAYVDGEDSTIKVNSSWPQEANPEFMVLVDDLFQDCEGYKPNKECIKIIKEYRDDHPKK